MLELAAQHLGPLAHARQAEVAGLGGAERIDVAEAAPVVDDPQLDDPVARSGDRDGARAPAWRPALATASWVIAEQRPPARA